MPSRPLATGAGVVVLLVLAAGAATLLPGAAPTASAQGLVPYGSCDALLKQYRAELEKSATPYGFGFGWGGTAGAEDSAVAMPQATARSAGSAWTSGAVGSGPTGTNVQEQGVDEPDVAKTADGLLSRCRTPGCRSCAPAPSRSCWAARRSANPVGARSCSSTATASSS